MAEQDAVYKCNVCGNVVEVVEAHAGVLVCCGKEMVKQKEQTADFKTEKHVPVVEVEGNKVKVTVGSTLHPMTEEHFIELIEVLKDGKVIKSLRPKPGQKPEAEFCLEDTSGISAREYCNVHLLWKS